VESGRACTPRVCIFRVAELELSPSWGLLRRWQMLWMVSSWNLMVHDGVEPLGGNMVIRSHAELRKMLEEERTRLKLLLKRAESPSTENIGYGNHMADDATEAFEQARDLSVRARVEDTLIEVGEALRKFELGTYGVCESCGVTIDWARLEAKPAARLCIKCQRRRDFGL